MLQHRNIWKCFLCKLLGWVLQHDRRAHERLISSLSEGGHEKRWHGSCYASAVTLGFQVPRSSIRTIEDGGTCPSHTPNHHQATSPGWLHGFEIFLPISGPLDIVARLS